MLKLVKGFLVLSVVGGGLFARELTANDDQVTEVEGFHQQTEVGSLTSVEDIKSPEGNVTIPQTGKTVKTSTKEDVIEETVKPDEDITEVSSPVADNSVVSGGTVESNDQTSQAVQVETVEVKTQPAQPVKKVEANVQPAQPAKKVEVNAESKPAPSTTNTSDAQTRANEEAIKKAAEQKAQADAQAKRDAEKEAQRQAEAQAEKVAAQKVADEAAKKAAIEAAKPKFAPNSVFVNGKKVTGNVNGRVITNVADSVFSAGQVVVSDANGHGSTVNVGTLFEVKANNTRFDNSQDVTSVLNGSNGFVFIYTINNDLRLVAQGH